MATVEVILADKIKGLGVEADVVKVKRGFAANYLLPSGKAYPATKGNLRHLEKLQAKRAEREGRELTDAQTLASKIRKIRLTLALATGKTGKAFGSVTTMDIAKSLAEEHQIEIDRHNIDLPKAIKNTGDFDIPIKIHPEVQASLTLKVHAKESAEEETPEEESSDRENASAPRGKAKAEEEAGEA